MTTQDYRTYYTVQHPENFDLDWKSFYQRCDERTAAARKELLHVLDLAYGPDPKQRLDIYQPPGAPANAPVLLFLHGGGFLEGDRANYGFIAPAYAKHGVIVVIASYRLVSGGFSLLAAVDDAKSMVKWVYRNIASHGGNPNSIVLSGHSAGAILSANLGVDLAWMQQDNIPSNALKAIVAVSGIYNFRADDHSRDNILTSPEIKMAVSAMQHIKDLPPKMIIAVGSVETDPVTNYVASSEAFYAALQSSKKSTQQLLILPGENHQKTSLSLGDERSPLFQATLAACA